MADFLDAGVSIGLDELLRLAGSECVYIRGNATTSITMRRSQLPPLVVDNDGQLIELRVIDFIARTADMPYSEPLAGDRIKFSDGTMYEVNRLGSDKCFRITSSSMIRIHTKLVN